jgi:hypothetical protein
MGKAPTVSLQPMVSDFGGLGNKGFFRIDESTNQPINRMCGAAQHQG